MFSSLEKIVNMSLTGVLGKIRYNVLNTLSNINTSKLCLRRNLKCIELGDFMLKMAHCFFLSGF